MKIRDLKIGQKFNIVNEDNAEVTVTEGRIVDIWSMRAGQAWGIQFDDELQTFTWGNDDDDIGPRGFSLIIEEA